MIYAAEIALLAFVVYKTRLIIRRGGAGNLIALFAFALALIGGGVAFAIMLFVVQKLLSNVVWRYTIAAASAIFAYCLIRWSLFRKTQGESFGGSVASGLEGRVWLDRSITAVVLCVFLFCMLMGTLFFANLVAREPSFFGDRIADQSLFMHLLQVQSESQEVAPNPKAAINGSPNDSGEQAALEEALARQATFFQRFSSKLNDSKQLLAEKTGTKAVMEYLDAVKEIVDLPWNAKLWLKHSDADVFAMLTHPKLIAVAENEQVVALVEEASQGSISAVYRLGDNQAIIALMEDQELLGYIRTIDVLELRKRVRARMAWGTPFPTVWSLAELSDLSDPFDRLLLDKLNKLDVVWSQSALGNETVVWNDGLPYRVARSTVSAGAPSAFQLRTKAAGHVRLWIDKKEHPFVRQDDWLVAQFESLTFDAAVDLVVVWAPEVRSSPAEDDLFGSEVDATIVAGESADGRNSILELSTKVLETPKLD